MDNLKEQLTKNIWTALSDYFRHTDLTDVYDNISDAFVDRLVEDSIKSKRDLRDLFRKSQGWNENLQSIIINGIKTHNPDYSLVHSLASSILRPVRRDSDYEKCNLIERAIYFFSRPDDCTMDYIDAINALAPQA